MNENENMSLYVSKLKEVLKNNSEEYKKIRAKINEIYNLNDKKE
ncbi:hypothetical protein [Clostridioides difficile]|nr:hypothetical protein [Clostridioides difficile]